MKIVIIKESEGSEEKVIDTVKDSQDSVEAQFVAENEQLTRVNPKFPAANIRETETKYILDLLVPGLDKEHLEIEVDDDKILSIVADGIDDSAPLIGVYKRREFVCPGFTRFFQLPGNALEEEIGIKYNNGILTLIISKEEISNEETLLS